MPLRVRPTSPLALRPDSRERTAMKDRPPPSPAIVVGVDGSRAALTAALWAVAEAEERDLPLRLLYAIEPRPVPSADQAARDLAAAEISIREAFMAIEALNLPLKIEVEIVQDNARRALINASYSALMLCLGSRGSDSPPDVTTGRWPRWCPGPRDARWRSLLTRTRRSLDSSLPNSTIPRTARTCWRSRWPRRCSGTAPCEFWPAGVRDSPTSPTPPTPPRSIARLEGNWTSNSNGGEGGTRRWTSLP